LREVIDELEARESTRELARHFQKYASQPAEQLAGIMGTVGNYLHYFTTPEIAEVFCRDSTFSLSDVDHGKIICLALPQKFQTERRYVGTLLKQLVFIHALRRFDLPRQEREKKNLLLFLADEAQHFLTVSEDGLSDHHVVDVVREAGVAFVAATQSSTSLVPALGSENAKVLLLNLRNRIIFTAADEDDARASAEFLGKKPKRKRSRTRGRDHASETVHDEDAFRIEPHELRGLRNHECILVHAESKFRRCFLPPIEADGRVSGWYRRGWRFW
jgi:type IV secretory pathway TraG/TraD family ATPase VirD4